MGAVETDIDVSAVWQEVLQVANRHELSRIGVAPAEVMSRARRLLVERSAAGLSDTMQFTYRNPERSTDPRRTVPEAQCVIVAALRYPGVVPERPVGGDAQPMPLARVARYAWTDHYARLRAALGEVAQILRNRGERAVVVVDDNALVDREAAWLGGVGWFGKNANLLVPGEGSYVVLGNVITTASLPVSEPVEDACGPCRRCLDSCPTGAIVAPGTIDAGRCLAWLLQRPGMMDPDVRLAVGDRLYGCDDCQEVCPPTVRTTRVEVARSADTGDAWVPVLDLLDAADDDILARYGRWYLHRRDPRWLRRNALVVLGNVGDGSDVRTSATLRRYLDPRTDSLLRAHAIWAAFRLGRHDLVDAMSMSIADASDVDIDIRRELDLRHCVPVRAAR